MMKSNNRYATGAFAALGLFLLSACATPTPYMPAVSASATRYAEGYSETKIEENRFRLTFAGNSLTSRQTVEDYLLYRASELTLEKGYDWFLVVTRFTKEDKRASQTTEPPFAWRYYYGSAWSPWSAWNVGYTSSTLSFERYEAQAEIVMNKGPKPADNASAYSAAEVKANLESKIIRPVAK